jgi:uncharacterized phiE125 gp8 family phage protein
VALALADAKAHLRLETTADDDYVTALIAAATAFFEDQANLKLITQTVRLSLPDFTAVIRLPRMPVQSVDSVKYLDAGGTLQTLATTDYTVSLDPPQAVIVPAYGKTWPSVRCGQPQGVQVDFVAGYGDTAAAVPALIKHGLKFLVAHWYAQREPVAGAALAEVPMAVDAILSTVRMIGDV